MTENIPSTSILLKSVTANGDVNSKTDNTTISLPVYCKNKQSPLRNQASMQIDLAPLIFYLTWEKVGFAGVYFHFFLFYISNVLIRAPR